MNGTDTIIAGQTSGIRDLNDCGCCEGLAAKTPVEITNRPGLTAIAYRIGTHTKFKQSLLSQLSSSEQPALAGLKTREDNDPSIVLLDAWATVADVLTFYQERIANESYLRTATERRSLLEQARLIGYELRPGVAADTYLVFTLEDAPGAPRQTTIDAGNKVQSFPGPGEKAQTFETIEKIEARVEWNAIKPQLTILQELSVNMDTIWLKGTDFNLRKGDMLLIVAKSDSGLKAAIRRLKNVDLDMEDKRTMVTLEVFSDQDVAVSKIALSVSGVYALRVKSAPFGHNAPYMIKVTPGTGEVTRSEWPLDNLDNRKLALDAVHDGIQMNSLVVISSDNSGTIYKVTQIQTISRASYGMGARVTQLTLNADWTKADWTLSNLRTIAVLAQIELLTLIEKPWEIAVEKDVIQLDRQYEGLKKGQQIIVSGKIVGGDDKRANEVAIIEEIVQSEGRTKLILHENMVNTYVRDTVTINANVARATHGETVQEVLGSGDAGQSYQRFALRQPPLTHVSGTTPSGAESTLQVRVNDLLWKEVPSLYGRGPNEHIYVTRTNDDGKTTIQFGDGVTGARLPAGQENVRAVYRKGIGLEGLVKGGQLTTLMTRPLGVKGVSNLLPATGAADRESLDDARRNAPHTVLTLERAVSLQDYEDFARAFAGIAKALATWTWDSRERGVFITAAGPKGAEIESDSPTYQNLMNALRKACDPYVNIRLKSYRKAFFRIKGRVSVLPEYLQEKVLGEVMQALRTYFSFDARMFGQPVMMSEVITVIQGVPGVEAVDLDKLYLAGKGETLNTRLVAEMPAVGSKGDVKAAELLTLDPAPIELGVMP